MDRDLELFDSVEITKPDFGGRSTSRPWLQATAGAALLGGVFAAISTSDFTAHLDRQVHSIHCSLIPGTGATLGESGCRTVMMSPYSSLFRESLWGGLPISLLALAVFAYLVSKSLRLSFQGDLSKRDTKFLVAATLLPVVMSLIYGIIAATEIGAACTLCIGIYVVSVLGFLAAVIAHRKAPAAPSLVSPLSLYGKWFAEGVAHVAALVLVYLAFAPTAAQARDGCGTLVKTEDRRVMLPMGSKGKGVPGVAVIDPLCPACRAFERRLAASSLGERLSLSMVLFPLDSQCNWMVEESLHPGACAVSEAMLCAPESSGKILDWAFEHQEELLSVAKKSESDLVRRITSQFPEVQGCVGTTSARHLVTKSLRWAVANAIPVLTPQLFVRDRRVCDEDTDLGLEYTVASMIESGGGKRK